MKAKKSYRDGGVHPKGLKRATSRRGLKKSDNDNSKMVDMENLKKKKRKVVPFLSKKGSNRKMK
jgi:hypothetical protein